MLQCRGCCTIATMIRSFSFLLTISLSGAFAQGLQVSTPVAHQVIQRGSLNRAEILLKGKATGNVEARVSTPGGLSLPGLDWKPVAAARGGNFSGKIAGVPTGGPYTIELRAAGMSQAVNNVFVGDLWILAGQSNMEGVGNLEDVQPPHPMVQTFDMNDVWGNAKEPLHSLPDSADRVHWRKNQAGQLERLTGEARDKFIAGRKKGAGLGLPFAVELYARTKVPVGLVPCAHGGTSMAQWNPDLKSQAGDSLYGATIRRFNEVGGKVAGILWYQGESDAAPNPVTVFAGKFEQLIAAFRADMNSPNLPFYYVQIGRHVASSNPAEWNRIQQLQLEAEKIRNTAMVSSIDSVIDDGIHVSTSDQKKLGRNLAMIACHDLFPDVGGCAGFNRGPRPVSAIQQGEGANFAVRVQFESVNDKLRAHGRIHGFTVLNKDGAAVPSIYKSIVDPKDPSAVLLYISGKLPENAKLQYGFGRDPICNLEDGIGMAVPVFGPMPIQ